MLIRFTVKNVLSFAETQEFTTIPNSRLKTLTHHKYNYDNCEILKTSAIYGANAAGKSNLIKAISLLQALVKDFADLESELNISDYKFKLDENNDNQILAIEFIKDRKAYYYALEINNNIILTEELYLSGLGKDEDIFLFERNTNSKKETTLRFLESFENDPKSQLLKEVILEEFVNPKQPVLSFLAKRDNKFLKEIKTAFSWFEENLQIISPRSRPTALVEKLEKKCLKDYAEKLMCSFDIGISSLSTIKKELTKEVSLDQYEKLIKRVDDSPNNAISLRSSGGDEIVILKEDDQYWLKQLEITHKGKSCSNVKFTLDDESDGTVRLLDFIPAFEQMLSVEKTYIVDEIERSIHPLLIKELIKKFSLDEKTNGQLIFTTHEANLLDQEIFRQDEIWFCEKDMDGSTELYSLNDFKEHKTVSIQNGYLSGRYGSIPFLGNLKELNWHHNDS